MGYITELYHQVPADLNLIIPHEVEGVFLTRVEADEIWSFVGYKGNRKWIGLALDTTTKQVIACHIGGRKVKDAKALWSLIPEVYNRHSSAKKIILKKERQELSCCAYGNHNTKFRSLRLSSRNVR